LLVLRATRRDDVSGPRHRAAVMLPLILVALLGHAGLMRRDDRGRLLVVVPSAHLLEFYHYYVGAKYFDELGYDGIYEATVVADHQDAPATFQPRATIRDLHDNRSYVERGAVLRDADRILARFEPERWSAFKRDIALFRAALPDYWSSSQAQRDHGYNGTPFVTALLGPLANQEIVSPRRFIAWMSWFDLGLLLGVSGIVAALLGPGTALVFLFFWFANPLNDASFVGFSYLRYNYLYALVLAVALLERGRQVASGVCFAASAELRIFPGVLLVGLALQQLMRPERWSLLWAHRRLYIATALAALAFVGVGALLGSSPGSNAWLDFGERMRVHAPSASSNRMGLRFPFLYSESHDEERLREAMRFGVALRWQEETERTFARRRPVFLAVAATAIVLLLASARFLRGNQGLLIGMGAAFLGITLAHYYYAMLAILPLLFRRDRPVLWGLAGFMALLALTRWWLFDASEDFAFAVLSAEVGVFLIGLPVLLAIRQHGSAPERPEDAWLPRVPTQGEGRDERALEGVDHSR
jgi:hypothetical protein